MQDLTKRKIASNLLIAIYPILLWSFLNQKLSNKIEQLKHLGLFADRNSLLKVPEELGIIQNPFRLNGREYDSSIVAATLIFSMLYCLFGTGSTLTVKVSTIATVAMIIASAIVFLVVSRFISEIDFMQFVYSDLFPVLLDVGFGMIIGIIIATGKEYGLKARG